jgi:hypothetical protein
VTSLTPLAAALLLSAVQAQGQVLSPPNVPPLPDTGNEEIIDHGPILLIVHTGGLVIPLTTVIVHDGKDKQLVRSLLQASCPKEMGATPSDRFPDLASIDAPEALTIDEYIDRRKQGMEKNGLKGDKLQEAVAKIRSSFQSDLSKHFAVVERWERSTKPDAPYQGISDP